MADSVALSANEIKFMIKRSVEGLGFSPGDQLGAGMRVATCYQYGLVDDKTIHNALDSLLLDVQAPKVIEHGDEWVFDAHGQSSLVQAELAFGAAMSHGVMSIRLRNTSQGVLVAPMLMTWLSKPMNQPQMRQDLSLYYVHHDGSQRCLAMTANGSLLGLYEPHRAIVAEDEVLLRVDEKAIDGNLLESASDLIRQREACLDKGISLSATLVMRLKDLMMDSFVPESDQSRASGAGPG